MRIFNTLTKKVEDFIPHNKDIVTMYTCGPTVYHYAHIGNMRTYISEDVLEKTLVFLGYNVKRCMNITDVGHMVGDGDAGEDKMSVAAKREHKSSLQIAEFYTNAFKADCEKLNIRWPKIVSNASDNIDEYIKIVSYLIDNDFAYISDGNVYFDTTKSPNYYELSGRNSDDLIVAVREDISEDSSKRNPFDFGLWFTNSKFNNQELQWDSPWGRGYPGWHIECSGISIKYLGEYLDIHCGAEDAVFPHHTNEIAQSESYLGHKWCNYWVHFGFLNDNSGKMSKSNGEFLTVSVLEEKGFDPIIYRFYCLQSHYHKQLVFTFDGLSQTRNTYNKLINKIKQISDDGSSIEKNKTESFINRFKDELSDDLNTANAITVLYDVIKSDLNNNSKLYLIGEFDKVLSLNLIQSFDNKIEDNLLDFINEQIELRKCAKSEKNYELADKIRTDLAQKGIVLKDTRDGTTFEIVK